MAFLRRLRLQRKYQTLHDDLAMIFRVGYHAVIACVKSLAWPRFLSNKLQLNIMRENFRVREMISRDIMERDRTYNPFFLSPKSGSFWWGLTPQPVWNIKQFLISPCHVSITADRKGYSCSGRFRTAIRIRRWKISVSSDRGSWLIEQL